MEAKLQSDIIRFLKNHGAYVLNTRPTPGIPIGCPDIIFLYEGAWGAIEVKSSPKAPFRVGQEATLNHLASWSFAFVVYPENWPEIRTELLRSFF